MLWLAMLAVLTDTVVAVRPGEWKAVSVPVERRNSVVACTFSTNGPSIQALLVDRNDGGRFHRGRSIQPLQASGYVTEGRLRTLIPEPGEYVLLLDNRLDARTVAEVKVRVDVSIFEPVVVRTLPPEKRRVVVAVSLLFFGAVLAGSAFQLRRQFRG